MTHLHQTDSIFFVTCALKDNGRNHDILADPAFARIIMTRLQSHHGKLYKLIAYTILPNQFHLLIDLSIQHGQLFDVEKGKKKTVGLRKIIEKIKLGSEIYINQVRNTESQQLWRDEDTVLPIRDEKTYNEKISFIKENPVKIALANSYENHPFTYIK